MIAANGALIPPTPDAKPLPSSGRSPVTIENPPGLYGGEEGVLAHNLFTADAKNAVAMVSKLGPSVKLHLLQEVRIGSARTWVCTDLN